MPTNPLPQSFQCTMLQHDCTLHLSRPLGNDQISWKLETGTRVIIPLRKPHHCFYCHLAMRSLSTIAIINIVLRIASDGFKATQNIETVGPESAFKMTRLILYQMQLLIDLQNNLNNFHILVTALTTFNDRLI